MDLQDNCMANNLPQNDVVDFHMQNDNICSHKSLAEWLNQRNQLLADTCEESLQSCKRDWLNERGDSTRENRTNSVLNQCGPSNVSNGMTEITENNNGYHFDEYIPCIEIESDDDVPEEFIVLEEYIDLTDINDDTHEKTSGSTDLIDNSDLNDTMPTPFLSSCNVVDIASETPNQRTVECMNSENNDEVLSLHTDSDEDILSVHINSLDEVRNEELHNTMNYVDLNNMVNNDDDMFTSDHGMCTSILSTFNVIDTEDEAPSENSEINNIIDLNDHSFTSILSPFCVSNNNDNIEIEADNELIADVTNTEDITTVCQSMLSPVSITDTQKCDIDLTAEASSKRKKKKKKKKRKSTPPPHIIRKIIQGKRDKKWKQKREYQNKEIVKSDVKKEDIKEKYKMEICEEISPATTETRAKARTFATQTADIFRIAIKDVPDCIKQDIE